MTPLAAWRQLLVISAAWGTTLMWLKLTSATLGAFTLTFWRGVAALAALGLFLAARGSRPRLMRRDALVLGTTNGWLPSALMAFAMGRIDTAPASLVAAAMPLILAILAHLLLGERLTRRGVAGILMGFAGIALVLGPDLRAAATGSALGFAAMFACACSFAAGAAYGRWSRPADSAATVAGQQLVSVAVSAVLALLAGQGLAPPPDLATAGSVAALGTVATALPMVLYWRLLARAPAATAGFVDYLIPLWTVLFAVTLLGERPPATALAGGALVLAGIAVASGRRPREDAG